MQPSGSGTERLYYTDAYLRSFQAEVVAKSDDGLTLYLNRSAFYPTSGGQPADRGQLGAGVVLDVIDEEQRVAHVMSTPASQTTGDTIHGDIDWARRYDFMQQHSGQHLLSAVIEDLCSYPTVSVHLGDETSTIELGTGGFSEGQIIRAEHRCLELIAQAKQVSVSFEDAATASGLRKATGRTGTLRIVSIEGADRSACGGTHVRSLAELAFVQIRRLEKLRGNMRLEFVAGSRALNRVRQDHRLLSGMSKTCGVAMDGLGSHVAGLQQRAAEAEKRLQKVALEAAKRDGIEVFHKTPEGPDGVRRLRILVPSLTEETRRTAQSFVEQGKAIALILGSDGETVLIACSPDAGVDAGAVLKQAIAAGGGKGGGSATMAQGSLASPEGVAALRNSLGMGG